MGFSDNVQHEDQKLKMRKLVFRAQITGNATPASKVHAGDLEGDVALLRSQGISSAADALEAVSWTTADDGPTNSVFGILLDGSKMDEGSQGIEAVYACSVSDRAGSAGSLAASGPSAGSVASMLTAGGNIAIEIAGTGLDLEAENADIIIEIDYKLK